MSKKGAYNGAFFNAFATRLHGTPIRFGALIGAQADDGFDVVFAAPTPPLPAEDGEPAQPPKDVTTLLKSKGSMPFPDWAMQHAAALNGLLPGGLECCGCFAVASEAIARDLAPLLALVLKDLKEPLVLTVDPQSRKLSFWQYSGGARPALRPTQAKAVSHKDAVLLWAATPVDLVVPYSPSSDDGPVDPEALAAETQRCLQESLDRCVVGIAAGDAPLRVVNLGDDAAISSALPKDCREVQAMFLRSGTVLVAAPGAAEGPRLRLRCLIVATAVVLRRNVELRHAIGLLRKALAASAGTRLQLALEEAEGGARGRLNLPWRALRQPTEAEFPLWCGDYCMPDEAPGVELERLGQLLGLPETAFEEAPVHLDERARLERDHQGTYGPPPAAQGAGAPSKATSGLPVAACAAIAALVMAVTIPLLLRQ